MPRLALHLLGSFQARLNNRPVKGFDSDKVRALLAYLAVESDRPHRRESLAGLLWPEQPEQTARSNLRYALSNLRRVIGDRAAEPPFLQSTRHALQFNPEGDSWVDVTAFTQNLSHQQIPPTVETITQLEETVALYRGDFLAGFSLSNSALFEEWVLFTCEKLAQQATAALRHLLHYYEQYGNLAAAQTHARRLLQLEPWDEEIHQTLMRLLALGGQRGAALAQYQTCRQILADEMGIEPLPETTGLYHRIRDGKPDQEIDSPPAKTVTFSAVTLYPDPAASRRPFVARENELAQLDQTLKTTLAGEGRVMFITGEAGSGKTTLIHQFVQRAMAQHRSLVVARGICNAYTGLGDPYLPFREIVQTLTGDIETRRAGGNLNSEHARRLWAIWPEAIRILLDAGPDLIELFVPGDVLAYRAETFLPAAHRADWQNRPATPAKRQTAPGAAAPPQQSVFQQVTRVLGALARHCPLVLVLDDLQWADSGSLNLLFHLSRSLADHRILIIGAYRPAAVLSTDSGDRHPLPAIVNEIKRLLGDCHLDLDQADGRQLVEAYLDAKPNRLGNSFRETLFQQTGGNPLFTVELLDDLQAGGVLIKDETGHWIEAAGANWRQLPTRVEAVIAERIGRLPEAQQILLRIAGVEGEEFTAEVVAHIQEEEPQTIIQTLSNVLGKRHQLVQSTRLQFLEAGGRRLSHYRFRHNLFQKHLYNQLDEPERLHLHQAVGSTLEKLYQTPGANVETADIWPRLAYHFEAAGLLEKAVGYLLLAGNRAARMSAHEEAIAMYSKGLTLLQNLPESQERTSLELELQLALGGQLVTIQGWGTKERIATCRRAFDLCLQVGGTTQLLRTLFLQADVCRAQGKLQDSLNLGEQLLILTHTSQDPLQIALPYWTLGETYFFQGDIVRGQEYFEQAVALYGPHNSQALTALGGVDMKVSCLSWLSWILWMQGYPDQAVAQSEEALALARKLEHPFSLSFALGFSGCGLRLLRREPEHMLQFLTTLEQIVNADQLVVMQPWSMVYRGWQQVFQAQLAEGIAQIKAGMTAWQTAGAVSGTTVHALPLLEGYRRNGQTKEALTLIAEIQAMIEDTGERLVEAEIYRLKGELALKKDEVAGISEAEACFLQAIEISREQRAKMWELRATMSLTRLWQQTGRGDEVLPMLVEIYNWFTEGFDTPDLQAAGILLEELSLDSAMARRWLGNMRAS